jgi:hypothetical protein
VPRSDSPVVTLGSPLVSPGLPAVLGPADRRQRMGGHASIGGESSAVPRVFTSEPTAAPFFDQTPHCKTWRYLRSARPAPRDCEASVVSVADRRWRWYTTLAVQTCQLRPPRTFPLVGPANPFLSLSRSAHIRSMLVSILSNSASAGAVDMPALSSCRISPRCRWTWVRIRSISARISSSCMTFSFG